MDSDLNAYRCAEPHGGCCQPSKIRPYNYFLLEHFSVSLFWGVRAEILARE
jgi:hypothetical protein